jgi:hypothetical protein
VIDALALLWLVGAVVTLAAHAIKAEITDEEEWPTMTEIVLWPVFVARAFYRGFKKAWRR